MKGSLTAVISTSLCSTLGDCVSWVKTRWSDYSEEEKKKNVRVAEDNPSNATEAVDSDLKEAVSGCDNLCGVSRALELTLTAMMN
ncbi:hypothetical protein K504DRAFT_465925 [Pleomassaria siparia CBS 279.74]|uniref:Uncharacterized protein n=1 Tax=Pleomassaria siparia CBS 279.74 TaxID=1314801 RepID=A0A6G1KDG3_9PLEO|nr:hypothetical protein K504DRAFT_465925 [Pleomassaria siparia CBS 279.74]